ncbi:MAG: 23S rRNA (guanosine(2251)-2'-O)-methyltransferase RlmB [Thermodesulfovibrionales bacterium]|nr:23S rRNA (guanosine(2251)-2'-O)-methyltransferase RlmB [Thermodesulfovibrionales bacterium]
MKITSSSERTIYGVNPIKEALKAKKKFISLYVQVGREREFEDIIKIAKSLSIKPELLEKSFFDTKFPKGHQGIAGKIVDCKEASLEDILKDIKTKNELPFFIILDGVEDPRNLGAIIRTTDAVSAHAVIHQANRSAHLTGVTSKASSGATEFVRVIETANIKNIINKLKSHDISIFAADSEAKKTFWDVDFNVPLAIILGGEDKGLRPTIRTLCDETVRIPMTGNIKSLNVSVAMAVISFEIMRQRLQKKN